MHTKVIQTNQPPHIYSHEELPADQRFFDRRTTLQRKIDNISAIFKNLRALLRVSRRRFSTSRLNLNTYYCFPKQPKSWNAWKANSTGLHIFIHGFLGHPAIWKNYIKTIRNFQKDSSDIRAPFVPHRGNCKLEEATDPIRVMVKNYLEHQLKTTQDRIIPLCIYGTSNGGRIALNILNGLVEASLEDRLKAKNLRVAIKVNAIAGIFRGTQHWKARLGNHSRFTKWLAKNVFKVSLDAVADFKFKSDGSKKLIDTARKVNSTATINIKYAFHSTTEDELIIPHYSSLPILGKGETHNIVHGEGHTSIVECVLPKVMEFNEIA